MAYESFTLEQVEERFELALTQTDDAYGTTAPIAPSDWLQTTLRLQTPLVTGKTSEKARSELLVSPVLVEVREIKQRTIALFSGIAFNVDKKAGLHGYCDFLISREAIVDEIKAPVLFVTEAKKEDLSSGVGQCLAEMVAAQLYNERRKKPIDIIYGSVTDGTRWRFLSLAGKTASLDLREYTITELPLLLGILAHMAR